MAIDVEKLSRWDSVRFFFLVSTPASLWGLAAPNRFFVSLLVRWNVGERTARFLAALRQKYRSGYLRLWFPFPWFPTLLVMEPRGMDAVLASRDNAADPELKKHTLSQFVPDALVVSSGDPWRDRRTFNESVLQFGHPMHRHADAFVDLIGAETQRLVDGHGTELRWADFQALAERISHQVLLGQGHIDPQMTAELAKVVKRSNWYILPREEAAFSAFYNRVDAHSSEFSCPAKGPPVSRRCLLADSAAMVEGGGSTPVTSVPTQIGFWFFVLKDALEINVARTLALIAAHPESYDRVQREIAAMRSPQAQAINGLNYLEACIREQLRLWTPVPILLRRAVNAFSLLGEVPVAAGEQILIHAGFYHRDPAFFGESVNTFSPAQAMLDTWPPLYSFSAGHQSCAGQFLARFLLKATLASLLARFRFELQGPRVETSKVQHSYDHFKIRMGISPVSAVR
jgi:cytochrome P450